MNGGRDSVLPGLDYRNNYYSFSLYLGYIKARFQTLFAFGGPTLSFTADGFITNLNILQPITLQNAIATPGHRMKVKYVNLNPI